MATDSDPSSARRSSRPAILLLGHGSHVDGRSSDSVHHLARMLRASGRYPEVRVAFWKEEPQLRHAFLLVESPRVVAVPFFTSEGYFTDRVLPRELRIDPPVSTARRVARPEERGSAAGPSTSPAEEPTDARRPDDPVVVHYTRAVGAHPAMADVVLERALDRLDEGGLLGPDGTPAADTTLVVLGHGTERHPASGEVVEGITARLARESSFHPVTCCFLDQDPRMLPVLESVDTARAVMVPFFMAEGWHVGQTIPRDLDLRGGRSRVGGTEVLFTEPVGTHPAMVRVVEQMVAEATEATETAETAETAETTERAEVTKAAEVAATAFGRETVNHPPEEKADHPPEGEADRRGEGEGHPGAEPSPPLPTRARRAFLSWIDAGGDEGRTFLETRVRRSGTDGAYEIRHVADTHRPSSDLEGRADPEWALSLAARTDGGEHRPLKTAPNLPRGWVLEDLHPDEVWEAYAHLYPAAPVHWYLGRVGALPTISFRETAGRQTGMYRVVAELGEEDVRSTRAELCEGGCLRTVRWPLEGEGGIAESPDRESEVPCPEPCSLFITRARERAPEAEGPGRG